MKKLTPFGKSLKARGLTKHVDGNWRNWLEGQDPDAWLATLVMSVNSLTSMSLEFWDSSYFLPLVARVAAGKTTAAPVLQRIQSVSIHIQGQDQYYQATDVISFFCLPAMETNNGGRGFADYITSCANLEVLDYQHERDARGGTIYVDFRPILFYNALCSQKHSLRELRLNNNGKFNNEPSWDDEPGEFDGFGSLAEFHQLCELQIGVRTILQYRSGEQPKVSLLDILPSSLEVLGLAHCYEKDYGAVIENLQTLLAHRE
ncbi:unnamed protein product [Penicillium salamii]|uniref:Leucine-rich repeat domain-containing protein n=1 Tax=Penicillium salamii TaxID=1612424 RepID=A0A9W4NXS6_9EURO|nr:unnamed protein product [Penicillium salamii]